MFDLLMPLSYGVLSVLWLVILGLYVGRLRHMKAADGTIAVLLTILALDAFRTLFESVYFGLYFNSQAGYLPVQIEQVLGQPKYVLIPKLINVIAGVLVLFLLIRRWLPKEVREKEEAIGKLRHSEELYRDFVEGTADLVVKVDGSGVVTFANSKSLAVFGVAPESCIGLSLFDFVHPDDRESMRDAFSGSGRPGEKHMVHECRVLDRAGALRHMLWTITTHRDEHGELLYTNSFARDITTRRMLEDCQAFVSRSGWVEQEEDFLISLAAYLSETLHVKFAFIDELLPGGTRVRTAGFAEDGSPITGIEYDLAGTPCANITDGGSCSFPMGVQEQFPKDQWLVDAGVHSYVGTPLFSSGGAPIGLIAVMDDKPMKQVQLIESMLAIVAVRATFELDRRRSEKQRKLLSTAVDQAAEAIVITGTDGLIEYVNPAFERLSGYSTLEAVGKNPRVLKSGSHSAEFYSDLWRQLSSGRVWKGRFKNVAKDGRHFEEEATISPVRDAKGTIINYVAVKRDITREGELEAQLKQTQKMEAIGTLAGGIAHDFNNLLQIMLGYLDLAKADMEEGAPALQSLEEVATAGRRASDLVGQILAFSRQSTQQQKPILLGPIVKEVLKLLRAGIPSTIEIDSRINSTNPVLADPIELHQVAMNLCTNAYHAMREKGGVLEVKLDEVNLDAAAVIRLPGQVPGRKVRLTIRDTGMGMDSAIVDRIFDPYFTTKKIGEGTGLGLSTVHGIVEGCKGVIQVESELGEGTVFELYFPVASNLLDGTGVGIDASELPMGTEHILYIDDEPMLTVAARLGLERFGYTVESRTSSVEALELFRSAPDRFDIVITDQTMPNFTGMELAQEMIQIRPNLPIILCTGFSELVDEASAKQAGIQAYINKPVLPRELAKIIRELRASLEAEVP